MLLWRGTTFKPTGGVLSGSLAIGEFKGFLVNILASRLFAKLTFHSFFPLTTAHRTKISNRCCTFVVWSGCFHDIAVGYLDLWSPLHEKVISWYLHVVASPEHYRSRRLRCNLLGVCTRVSGMGFFRSINGNVECRFAATNCGTFKLNCMLYEIMNSLKIVVEHFNLSLLGYNYSQSLIALPWTLKSSSTTSAFISKPLNTF